MTELFVPEKIGLEKMPNGGAVRKATSPGSWDIFANEGNCEELSFEGIIIERIW
jgi:hypothetical protein